MLGRVVGLGLCSLLATACSAPSVFGCDADTQCTQDGAAGTCELNGFCSFDDVACDSGRRYGSLAGNGLAERCVLDPDEASGTDAAGSTTGVASTSTATSVPTSTSLTSSEPASSSGPGEDATGADSSSSSSRGGTDGPTAMPEEGLVLRFSFEERADTMVGAYDLSGNELDATCGTGECPALIPGVIGNAASFDGVTDRLEVADHPLLRFSDAMSISAWLLYEGEAGVGVGIGKPFESNDRNSYELYVDHQATPELRYSMDSEPMGEAYVPAGSLFVAGEWKHVVGTYDNGDMVLYIDNEIANEGVSVSPRYDDQPLTIGGDLVGDSPLHYWRGAVDEVRIYDRALTRGEVEVLFGEGRR